MLSAYRVLDLADERGVFCGYLLAHLGAEVIAVEPPGGSPLRRQAPFAREGEDGLLWQAYARGKQSVVCDLDDERGRERLRELVRGADFLLESFEPRVASAYGLEPEALQVLNPALIHVSITPFGGSGPKAGWPATDLTTWAASGAHALAGDDDRAPVRTSVPQSFLHAGADAAGAALIALYERQRSGLGQHVDVSAQQSSAQAALAAILVAPNGGVTPIERVAGGLRGRFPIQLTWPCRDGYVAITLLFGPAFSEPNRKLLRWIHEHGGCTADDVETDWGARIAGMTRDEEPPDAYYALCRRIEAFTRERTQAELFEEGLARGLYIAPTNAIPDLLDEPHFRERGFWHELPRAAGEGEGTLRVPGAFAKLSGSPLVLPGRAPALGATPPASVGRRAPNAPPPSPTGGPADLPLSGLKVLDFMWVIAGPFFTRVLADYGATVLRVESETRLDAARPAPPFVGGEPGVETSLPFHDFNAGKLGVTFDPGNPAGREVLLDLVRWADVVTESFSPKAMKNWGLDYAALREVNPSLVMLSSCLMGQTGPRALVPGYGNMAAALTGFYELTGWPDRSPAGPYLAYTDGVSPRFMLLSLLAALEHRRQTGEGQHIDVSQAEAAIHLLAPAILDFELTGRVQTRAGNRDAAMAPHGVYPAAGDDRWVAIACPSDAAWRALADVMELEELLRDPALVTVSGRLAKQDRLDRAIGEWTRRRPEGEIEATLIAAGVPAHVVQNTEECARDPQLAHRGHFARVAHPLHRELVVEGSRFQLSRTPARVERGAPTLGEHNAHVLEEILGYDPDRIADLIAAGALGG